MKKMVCGFLVSMAFISCEKDKDEAIIPTYVKVEETKVVVTSDQGTTHHQISELWVYADSVLIGAYPVPSEFPVIVDREFRLDLFPGIRENGLSSSPRLYPFFRPFSADLSPLPGESHVIEPMYSYLPGTVFAYQDDFESGHQLKDDLDGDPETAIVIVSEDSPIESQSGRAVLTPAHPVLEVATTTKFELPVNGSPVFLEMEYKSEVPVLVGLRGHRGSSSAIQYKLSLFPRESAQKVYVNFSPDLQASQLDSYQIIFQALYNEQTGGEMQYLMLDNLKLLHF